MIRVFFTSFLLFASFVFFSFLPQKTIAEEYEFQGIHFLASYSQCEPEALTNVEQLKSTLFEAVTASGATIIDSAAYLFPPSGLTMVFLLSESHMSIHTYPEHGACFIDLFTCGSKCSSEKFDQVLRSYLKPKQVNAKTLLRSEDIKE